MDQEEHWLEVDGYPNYSVSDQGRVLSHTYDKIMATQVNNVGIVRVGLVRDYVQESKSVAILVATAWVDGYSDIFNSPIHLDGDKQNVKASNLAWRPRWFAVKYHKQFKEERFLNATPHILDVETGTEYHSLREPAVLFGLLGDDIEKSFVNETHCFPSGRNFRKPPERHFLA